MILPKKKFGYNNSINWSTGKSPFYIVYGSIPRNTFELRKLDKGEKTSAKDEDFVEDFKKFHEEAHY